MQFLQTVEGWIWVGISFVVGTVAGHFIERRAQKWFDRVKVEIRTAATYSAPAMISSGLSVTVTNRGEGTLEPFRICLSNPDFGRRFMFARGSDSALAPGQHVEFTCHLFANGKPTNNFLAMQGNKQWFQTEGADIAFQLVTDHTEHQVIFESRRLGRAFAKVLSEAWEIKSLNVSGLTFNGLHANPQGNLSWLWDKMRRRKLPSIER